jgi:hypothetical protein
MRNPEMNRTNKTELVNWLPYVIKPAFSNKITIRVIAAYPTSRILYNFITSKFFEYYL